MCDYRTLPLFFLPFLRTYEYFVTFRQSLFQIKFNVIIVRFLKLINYSVARYFSHVVSTTQSKKQKTNFGKMFEKQISSIERPRELFIIFFC